MYQALEKLSSRSFSDEISGSKEFANVAHISLDFENGAYVMRAPGMEDLTIDPTDLGTVDLLSI